VLETIQMTSEKIAQNGYLYCEKGYLYTLLFDNSESIFRSRKIFYSVISNEEENQIQMDAAKEEQEKEIGNFGMEDLMSFVRELMDSEQLKKN